MGDDVLLTELLDSDTSTEDLFRRLAVENPQSNAFPGDQIRKGRAMFLSWYAQLQGAICGNGRIASHPAIAGSDNSNDLVALAAVVAAEIPTEIGTGINNFLIAALIVRIGVRKFCEGYDPSDAGED